MGAFLVDLGIEATVIWNGTLRVTWTSGMVRGVPRPLDLASNASSSVPDDFIDPDLVSVLGNFTDDDVLGGQK